MDSVYSINIERAVLSSILFNPEELEDVLGVLKPKDFYLPAHKKIFEVMVKLHSDDMPIDEEFIRKRVDSKMLMTLFYLKFYQQIQLQTL